MDGQGAVAEACVGGEDIVCGFDPTERFRVGVVKGDVVHDRSVFGFAALVNEGARNLGLPSAFRQPRMQGQPLSWKRHHP